MGGGIDQDTLDRLFTAALEAAVARMEKDGHFFPLVFELRGRGTIHNVAMLETGPVDGTEQVLERIFTLLRERVGTGTVTAAAIVCQGGPEHALTISLYAANYSADVDVGYDMEYEGLIRRRRRLLLGEITARAVPNQLF